MMLPNLGAKVLTHPSILAVPVDLIGSNRSTPSPHHTNCARIRAKGKVMKTEIAQVTCSDCNQTYFATLVEDGGRWTLGKRVPKPKNTSKCRKRRMLCGDC